MPNQQQVLIEEPPERIAQDAGRGTAEPGHASSAMENEGCPNPPRADVPAQAAQSPSDGQGAGEIDPGAPTAGMLLLQNGLLLPDSVHATRARFSAEWQSVAETGHALDRELRREGWSCFFLPVELEGFAFGSSPAALHQASAKLLGKVRALDCNCAEFTVVTRSNFLGIPFVKVRGHARHAQNGFVLDPPAQRKRNQTQSDWALSLANIANGRS